MSDADLIIRQMNRIGELEKENKQLREKLDKLGDEHIIVFSKKIQAQNKLKEIHGRIKFANPDDPKYYENIVIEILEVLGE